MNQMQCSLILKQSWYFLVNPNLKKKKLQRNHCSLILKQLTKLCWFFVVNQNMLVTCVLKHELVIFSELNKNKITQNSRTVQWALKGKFTQK